MPRDVRREGLVGFDQNEMSVRGKSLILDLGLRTKATVKSVSI